jgi:hypothetical protein
MPTTDYIPRPEKVFHEWALNFIQYAQLYASVWDVPTTGFDDVKKAVNDYDTAYKAAIEPTHSSYDIAKKDDAREVAEKAIRAAVKRYISGNPLVTNPQRVNCRLPIPSGERHPAKDPNTYVITEVLFTAPGELSIVMTDSKSESKAKPEDVHGWEMRYTIGPEPVDDPERMEHSAFSTRNPFIFHYPLTLAGQHMSFDIRYENTVGVKGPWMRVVSIILP